jgi:hypothetical protein
MVNLLSAAHHMAWKQFPEIWLCASCAVLWLVIRIVRSGWVQAGVLLMLCGLFLNGLVTAANAGTMPVVGMPSTVHPLSVMWRAATSKTRLPYLADQARLGFFSIGDLVMLVGGSLIIATCVHTVFRKDRGLVRSAWLKVLQTIISAFHFKSLRSQVPSPKDPPNSNKKSGSPRGEFCLLEGWRQNAVSDSITTPGIPMSSVVHESTNQAFPRPLHR